MDDTIFNSSMATSVTLTQAQIVTTAVIGSIILTLVVLNIVMYSIYKKLMQDPKPTIKLGKQEPIQLYQMRSTMEYNTLSNSSINQSQCRTLGGTSYSGEETMSVNYSSADVTRSFSHNRSMCSSSVHGSLALETSMEYQVSGTNKSCKERKQTSTRIIDESECERIEQESTDSLEIEAQIHDNSLQKSNKPQRLSDIHLYQCIKSQMNQDIIQSGITHEDQKSKPAPGKVGGKPLEVNCSREKVAREENKSKELKTSHRNPHRSDIPLHKGHSKIFKDEVPDHKSQRKEQPQIKNISKGDSARLSNHHKTHEPESNHLSDSRKRDHSKSSEEIHNQPNSRNHDHLKCSSEIDNQPASREHDQSRGLREHANSIKSRSSSRGHVHSRGSKEHVHSKSSRQHDLSRSSKEHTHQQSFRVQNEIKDYVDMADFENDTDTEASVLAALDSVQTYQGVQLLTSGEGLMGCPVVEFQNKAFEFSETKTSIEEVDDTDL